MGISANQARMLTLKGRKCDLEKQMQVILNNKLQIAQQTSKIANDYNNAISNRKLFIFAPSTDANQDVYMQMSPAALLNNTEDGGFYVAVRNSNGSFSQLEQDDLDIMGVEEGLRSGSYVLVREADMQTQDPKNISFDADYGGATGSVITATPMNTDSADPADWYNITEWEVVDWRSSTRIMDKYDDSDDLIAQTEYEEAMSDLNVKETKMNIEMKDIETEHASISKEIESVDKIMKKNIEDSYKYFG